jgi:hypothetical protein
VWVRDDSGILIDFAWPDKHRGAPGPDEASSMNSVG